MSAVSEKQRRAMYAAAEGHSNLGIPQSVGKEFVAKDERESVRSFDADGRLHVSVSNISKANVCTYLGKEIPGWRNLGLDPEKPYALLRDPDELAKAVDTFNNLPILSDHVPVTADGDESHMPALVVGSTGTDAAIDGPYLTNSLVIWAKPSIDGIVNDEKKELSSAYRYTPDMTPGNFQGVDYDGIMRDIIGNHVALVFEGRAGSDVIVGDEQTMPFKSKKALMLAGGLNGLIRPLLAQDAAIDFSAALKDVNAKSLAKDGSSKKIAERVYGLAQPHLAHDAALDVDGICKVIDAVKNSPLAEDDDIPENDPDEEPSGEMADDEGGEGEKVASLLNYLKGKLSDEDYAEAARMVQAEEAMDEERDDEGEKDDEEKDEKDKPAMDAKAIAAMARKEALREAAAIRTAEREVAPVVGELVAMDSAAAVYKVGLDALGVDTAKLPVSAYGETFRAVQIGRGAAIAQDSRANNNSRNDFDKRYPKRFSLIRG